MDKAQAAFEILYLISSIDGDVCDDEIQVICTALARDARYASLEPIAALESLRGLSESQRLERFQAATERFADASEGDERRQLLATAIALAATDGESDVREQSLLGYLKTHWGT